MNPPSVVVLGATRIEQAEAVARHFNLAFQDVHILAHPNNPISRQLANAPFRLIVERQLNEGRIAAFRRVVQQAHRSRQPGIVVFWFDASFGAVRHRWNLRNLALARLLGTPITLVRYDNWRTLSLGGLLRAVGRRALRAGPRSGRLSLLSGLSSLGANLVALLAIVLATGIATLRASALFFRNLRNMIVALETGLLGSPGTPNFLAACRSVTHFVVLRKTRRRFLDYAVLLVVALLSLGLAVVLWPLCVIVKLIRRSDGPLPVLLVSHEAQLNGAPRSLLTLLQGIDRVEFVPILLSGSEGRLTEAAENLGVTTVVLPLSQALLQRLRYGVWLRTFLGGCVAFPWLLLALVNLRIRRVHINVIVTPDAALAARLLPGVQVIWHIRDTLFKGAWSRVQTLVLRVLAHRIVCNSRHVQNVLIGHGVFGPRIQVVYNAVDEETFEQSDGSAFRPSLGLPPDSVLIGCIGQITPDKGQETFVRACLHLAASHPQTHFILVGTMENTDFVDRLNDLIHQAPADVSARFHFTAFRSDVADILAALNINVVPSVWPEPFGRVAMEGMWLGVPTIASQIGGLPEIIGETGQAGILVPPGDPEALSVAIQDLLSNPDKQMAMGGAGKKRCRALFSRFRQIQNIQQVYRYPKVSDTRENHSRWWARVREHLPYRVRPDPRLLPIYAVLLVVTALWWAVTLPLFVVALPVAMGIGVIIRRLPGKPRVAVLCYQTVRNAGTRHRVTRVFAGLSDRYRIRLFYPSSDALADTVYVALFYGHRPHLRDAYYWLIIYTNRLLTILRAYSYRVAIIQYELMREGPMWMERLLAHTHPCVVYDFDDSLYAFKRYARELPRFLPKVRRIVAGNPIIAEWASQYNKNVTVIPTCVDNLPETLPHREPGNPIIVGWVGNPANLYYLGGIRDALSKLASEFPVLFRVICTGPYTIDIPNLNIEFREWSLGREQADIAAFDIGLMPVVDDEVGRGKCGFKLLQYMAAGVPAVVSPVGVNAKIVSHGENGLLAQSPDQWGSALRRLITQPAERQRIGLAGFESIRSRYTVNVAQEAWAEVLDELLLKSG